MNLESAKSLASALVSSGALTKHQAEQTLRQLQQLPAGGGDIVQLYAKLLLERGLLAPEQLEEALSAQAVLTPAAASQTSGESTGSALATEAGARSAPHTAAATPELPGYEILEAVGSGSMGKVYRARQLSMAREVAIKFLPESLARNQAFARRFIQEARTVARLSHLNIVTGIDVGEHEGSYYFVMEFLDGDTVGDVLRRGEKFEERRAVEIVRQIASALEHARQSGLVHRDVKPDNILMTSDGVPKLGDLGLALDQDQQQPARLAGTPQYISPEAVRREPVDTRSDIYSLGVTVLHMIAGRPPFTGTAPEVLRKHVTEGIPGLRDLVPTASARATALVAGMTAMNPEHRYATPADVVDAATIFLEQPGRSLPRPKGAPAPESRRAAAFAAAGRSRGGAVAAVVVIVGAGLTLWLGTRGGDANGDSPATPRVAGAAAPAPGRSGLAEPGDPAPPGYGSGSEPAERPLERTAATSTPDAAADAAAAREIDAARAYEEVRIFREENARDFAGAQKRLEAVAERFPGTRYAATAQADLAALANDRQKAANDELHSLRERARAHVAAGELARARQLWLAFPAAFQDTQAAVEAAQELRTVETRIDEAIVKGVAAAEAVALSPEAAGPDFERALTSLEDLANKLGIKDDERIAVATTAVLGMQARHAEKQASLQVAQVGEAAAALDGARSQADALLARLDFSAALACFTKLREHPGVAADADLSQQVERRIGELSGLAAVHARVLAALRGRDGDKIDYEGARGTLVASGDELHVRVKNDEAPLDLRCLDPAVLGEVAAPQAGVSGAQELLDSGRFLLYAAAFDQAQQLAEKARAAGAADGAVTALVAEIQAARITALEGSAAAMWGEAVLLQEQKKWKAIISLLSNLTAKCAATRFYAEHQLEIEDLLALAENDGVPPPLIAKILKGKVKILKSAPLVIDVVYDFSNPAQLEDFESAAFNLPGGGGRGGRGEDPEDAPADTTKWEVKGDQLHGGGGQQLYWKPEVTGDLIVEYEMQSPRHSNLGLSLYSRAGKSYLVMLGLDVGGGGGRMAGALGTGRNYLLKVDPEAAQDYDGSPWEAMIESIKAQSSKPVIPADKKQLVQVQVKGESVVFTVNKRDKLSAKDEDFRRGRISWSALGNTVQLDEVHILAQLDPKWLAAAEEAYKKEREEARRRAEPGNDE